MAAPDRFHLIGTYRTPKFRYGQIVLCEARGEVEIVGMTDAPIPWPIGKRGRIKTLVLYKDLVKAVRLESNQAVAHHWGLTPQTITKWRKLLGVRTYTAGTKRLQRAYGEQPWFKAAQRKAWSKNQDPERRAKLSAALRGRKKSREHLRKIGLAHRGKAISAEARAKMSAAHQRRGTRPPWLNPPWSDEEDDAVRTLSTREAAEVTGRTPLAVKSRRATLGVPAQPRMPPWTAEEDQAIRELSFVDAIAKTGRSRHMVEKRRRELGVARRSPRKATP